MKICKHCGKQKTLHKIEVNKNHFRFWCETCCEHYNKWQYKKLIHCIRNRFAQQVSRCTDGSNPAYENYGGRGIQVKFKSSQEFIDHIINDLGCDTFVKIRGLEIDRIDNDGYYEIGNLRLVTRSENMRNTRKQKTR